ncbi:MAG: hypothetical protein Ct9H300mP11_23820 [Chloroflexota bacterium]|nr:MAG: hypothetical protein Ct9H300mP11_23820 [Chloroflexota bacterium]
MAITFGVSLSVDDYWDVPEFARRARAWATVASRWANISWTATLQAHILNLPAMAAPAGPLITSGL